MPFPGSKSKGPFFAKWIRDIFKKKTWKPNKDRFTKTEDELKQELTEDQYKKLKYDKQKA